MAELAGFAASFAQMTRNDPLLTLGHRRSRNLFRDSDAARAALTEAADEVEKPASPEFISSSLADSASHALRVSSMLWSSRR